MWRCGPAAPPTPAWRCRRAWQRAGGAAPPLLSSRRPLAPRPHAASSHPLQDAGDDVWVDVSEGAAPHKGGSGGAAGNGAAEGGSAPRPSAVPPAATSSSNGSGSIADAEYDPNIFRALPPPANVGRKRQLAALLGAATLEFVLTGVPAPMH